MTLQELEQIKLHIMTEHAMNRERTKSRVTVSMGSCGFKAGAAAVLDELKRTAESGETVVTHTGCLGLCSYEPIVEVAVPGQPVATYCHMNPAKAKKVVEHHLLRGQPVKEWVLAFREE